MSWMKWIMLITVSPFRIPDRESLFEKVVPVNILPDEPDDYSCSCTSSGSSSNTNAPTCGGSLNVISNGNVLYMSYNTTLLCNLYWILSMYAVIRNSGAFYWYLLPFCLVDWCSNQKLKLRLVLFLLVRG